MTLCNDFSLNEKFASTLIPVVICMLVFVMSSLTLTVISVSAG